MAGEPYRAVYSSSYGQPSHNGQSVRANQEATERLLRQAKQEAKVDFFLYRANKYLNEAKAAGKRYLSEKQPANAHRHLDVLSSKLTLAHDKIKKIQGDKFTSEQQQKFHNVIQEYTNLSKLLDEGDGGDVF